MYSRSAFALVFALVTGLSAEDEKIRDKVYLSRLNEIRSLHIANAGVNRYVVLGMKRKLDSKLSKGKGAGEKANFGDSASTYCYKKESDLSEFEKVLLAQWLKDERPLSLSYTCAEISEEEKRKSFAGFAETNCQCLDFTFDGGSPGYRFPR